MAYDPLLIDSGSLRHYITIQTANVANVDSFGNPVSTWNTVLSAWAKIEGTTSGTYKTLVQSGAISSQATDIMTIRWPGSSVTLSPNMHIKFGDNTYTVQAVDNILRRNRVVRLICMAIDSDSN